MNCISDLGRRSDSSGPAKVEAAPEKFAKRSPPPIRQRYVSGATTFSEELEFWKTRTRHAEVRADVAEGKARNLQKQLKTKGGGTGTLELRKQRRRGGGVINPAEWRGRSYRRFVVRSLLCGLVFAASLLSEVARDQ